MLWKRWSEKRLAQRIAQGEKNACLELILTHQEPIFQFLCYLCGDPHDAEDITQETFIAAWSKIGNFKGRSSLATWLHEIAYHKYVDWQRKVKYPALGGENPAIDLNAAEGQSPLEGLLANEESRCLYRAIVRLEPPRRELIILHYFQNLSYREIADMLHEPPGTIKWRVSQSLDQLKSLMEAGIENEEKQQKIGKTEG